MAPAAHAVSGMITSRELRRRLHDVGVVDDVDALRWVAWASQSFGLIALGFEYAMMRDPAYATLRRVTPKIEMRRVVTEPFWRVFSTLSRQYPHEGEHGYDPEMAAEAEIRRRNVEIGSSWDRGHFYFRFADDAADESVIRQRGYIGMMFDRPSAEALLERVMADDDGVPVTDDHREAWIRAYGDEHNSKTAWPAFQMHVGKNRAGLKKNFTVVYSAIWPRIRGNQRKIARPDRKSP